MGRYLAMTIACGVRLSYCVFVSIVARNGVFQSDNHSYILHNNVEKQAKIIGHLIVVNSCIIIIETLIPPEYEV